MKTTVEIPDPLFTELKKYAAAHGLTFRQLLETSLRRSTFKGKGQRIHDCESIRSSIQEGRGG